jgi:hypothetical protein
MPSDTQAIERLLESFTAVQLRDLDLSLAPSGEGATRSKNHSGFVRQILRRYDNKKVVLHALRLEALLPFKHVFVFSFTTPKKNFEIEALKRTLEKSFPGLFDSPSLIQPESDGLEPEVCVHDRGRGRLFVKFVHLVETWKWERVSPTKKELKSYMERHPVTVSLMPQDALMLVCFPGYTQGAVGPQKQRTTYSDIAQNACSRFAEQTGIEAVGFPLRQTVELLLQKERGEVEEVRRYLRDEEGRMMFDSRESEGGLVHYVASTFRRETGINVPDSAWRSLFRNMENADILLLWKKKEVLTRVAFHDFAPELLFIWRSAADAAKMDDILKMVAEYHRVVGKTQLSEAVDYVDNADPGTVLRPMAVGQRFDLSVDETLGVMYRAVHRGLLETLFRVRTDDVLLDFKNEWKNTLSDFPSEVKDEKGHLIDLADSKNIEIAFRRRSA